MTKSLQTKIGRRDIELLTALDRCPLTTSQLRLLSESFEQPFAEEGNLRRRLRALKQSDLVRSWPYAMANDGRSPHYYKLTRDGYRLLYGEDVQLPRRRYFEAISPGHHHHTNSLADFLVHTIVTGHRQGIELRHYARENTLKLESDGYVLYPDAAFQLVTPDRRSFNFVIEVDNGTERVRSRQDVESIERKLRGYDRHQSQFDALDPARYMVLFLTTRSQARLQHILDLAAMLQSNPQRTVFVGVELSTLLSCLNPFRDAVLTDHRGLKRTLIPISPKPSLPQEATRPAQDRQRHKAAVPSHPPQETSQSAPAHRRHHVTV
ncbi:MAG: replication-relaxation family protein [Planctomycetaceae bacterium]|nr:replication-relaxation family protein [Planctomycetaceae bacterium]